MPRVAVADAAGDRPAEAGSIRQRWPLIALTLWAVLFAVEVLVSLYLCDGSLVFTLDDPYIHLAVADRILAGGYGVNASEFSSPSSSIIWPYLLAVTEALHLGPLGPLLINAAAAAAAVVTFIRILLTNVEADVPSAVFGSIVALIAVFATSSIALPMTGMEHCLHVWATIVTFAGLIGVARGRLPTPVHFAALVLMPLIRFEGIAFAIAAIVAFAALGRWRFAAWAMVAIGAALTAYVMVMSSRGLPILPSSVLLKSRLAGSVYEGSSAFGAAVASIGNGLNNPFAARLILLGVAVASGLWLVRRNREICIVCAAVLAAIAAHLVAGQYDWFHRYEVYIIALASLSLLCLTAHVVPLVQSSQQTVARVAVVGLICFASLPYAAAARDTPFASRGIYDQQYQMGRFVREIYRKPIAVNDLGLVAYRNPNFVLDLWGLGSEEVRRSKLAGTYGPDRMAALAEQYGVGLVLIYDSWFRAGVPASWTKVAVLHTRTVTVFETDVAIYRTPQANANEIAEAMQAFAAILPPRSVLETLP